VEVEGVEVDAEGGDEVFDFFFWFLDFMTCAG
jgi:hypothetical protein